jgi:hypothetical protein
MGKRGPESQFSPKEYQSETSEELKSDQEQSEQPSENISLSEKGEKEDQEEVEKTPQFIKEFSKEQSTEERRQIAEEIKAKREEYFTEKETIAEQLNEIENLQNRIEELSNSGLNKILNYFKLRKLRAEFEIGKKSYEELKLQRDKKISEEQDLSAKLSEKDIPPELQEAKEILNNFYKQQKEKWANSEYTKEEIKKYFSEEHLASLSMEDYILLLKRFPKEMVTHVTRQGVRDHTGHMYHIVGEGEYSDGFMKIIKDGRLRSPLGVYLIEEEKDKAIAEFLHLELCKNKEEALEDLKKITDIEQQWEGGSYADRMAIHFATQEVADTYYGSEKRNEIFIAFPSALITSQYYFRGQLTKEGGGYWNDQWVWANEEKGIDINAGLVFMPGEIKVDKNTGSRYELDESKKPIINQEYKDTIKKLIDSPDFYNFADKVMEIHGKFHLHFSLGEKWGESDLPLRDYRDYEALEKLEPFRKQLEQNFGITDPRLQNVLLDYHNLSGFKFAREQRDRGEKDNLLSIERNIEKSLRNTGILYIEAKNTVTSKEFWENYFKEHPDQHPKKVVYYKGNDPTTALYEWQRSNGIIKKSKEYDLGFPERKIDTDSSQATVGIDRFRSIAKKAIEKYFESKKEKIA